VSTEHPIVAHQSLNRGRSALAVWSICLVALAVVGVGVVTARTGGPNDLPQALLQGLGTLSTVAVGAVVATRLPRNPIGWLFCLAGLAGAVSLGATDLADYGLVAHPGSIPGAIWLAWLSNWIWAPYIVTLGWFVPLLFPTGTLPSPRWRIVAAAGIASVVAISISAALGPISGGQFPSWVESPLVAGGTWADVLGGLTLAATVAGILTLPLVAWSVVRRYRRGTTIERQQLKWFLATVAFIAPGLLVALALSSADTGFLAGVVNAAWVVVIVGLEILPLAIGVAVMRYRLYEIDRLVSRTVAYAIVTVVLAAVFAAAVLVLQAVLAPFTQSNELAVAGSTLLTAVLFQGLRGRVNRLVDRRFNRAHYDAERAVAAFTARLRDQVDPDRVRTEIAQVAATALEPTSVSVWLR
jgi:hypothetical protein